MPNQAMPRVLLLHGLMSGRAAWEPLRAELAGEAKLLAPELLGYGFARQPDCPYTVEAIADHLAPVVERFQPTHVLGHSMGAIVALALRARYGHQFDRIGVIGLPVYEDAIAGRRYLANRGPVVRLFLRNNRVAHGICRAAFATRPVWVRTAMRRFASQPEGIYHAMFSHCHAAHDGSLKHVVFGNIVPKLATAPGAPVCALHGTADESAPFAPVADLAPGAGWQLRAIDGARHQVMVTRPSVVGQWVREELLDGAGESEPAPAGEGAHPALN